MQMTRESYGVSEITIAIVLLLASVLNDICEQWRWWNCPPFFDYNLVDSFITPIAIAPDWAFTEHIAL